MIFTFSHERTLDSKNRLQIPAPWRSGWNVDRDGTAWFITPGMRENTLSLFTEKYFEQRTSQIETEFSDDPESLDFESAFYGSVVRAEMDSQGRIMIPDVLVEMAELGREIVLSGAKQRVDVWRKADYEQFRQKGQWDVFRKYMRSKKPGSAASHTPE